MMAETATRFLLYVDANNNMFIKANVKVKVPKNQMTEEERRLEALPGTTQTAKRWWRCIEICQSTLSDHLRETLIV